MSSQRCIAVKIRFLGAAYHGFQRQQNAVTVQQTIEEALFKILGEKTVIYGCSRTDTGVSAAEYVFHFHTTHSITPYKLCGALNHFLPPDIGVLSAVRAPADFHARYSTCGKRYDYYLRNARGRDPFTEGREYRYIVSTPDADFLNEQAQAFCGRHDFSAFCSAHDGAENHVRTVHSAGVQRQDSQLRFWFTADGFLYNMVRIMVGTLLWISEGKLPPGCIPDILESRDRGRAGMTAPACGLFLSRVFYEEDPFLQEKEEYHG